MPGVVYLLVISQANERKEQTLNKGCAFSSCSGGKQPAMGCARLRSGSGHPELSHGTGGAQDGRSPAVKGQVLLLLVGTTVSSGEEDAKERLGWEAELHCGPSCRSLALSGEQEICLARIHSSVSLLLEKKQSKWSLGFLIQSFS